METSRDAELGAYKDHPILDKAAEGHVKQAQDAIKKALDSWFSACFDSHYDAMIENFPICINDEACKRANKLLDRVLAGDEEAARALFNARESSRRVGIGFDEGRPWSQIIHGKLHTTGEIKLREALVNAHADLLRNERILDLESQLEGVTSQLREANKRLNDRGSMEV